MKQVVFILIQNQVGKSDDTIAKLHRIAGIKSAHFVTGEYDVIAVAELPDLADLKPLINKIHGITGVNNTSTCLAIDNSSVTDNTFSGIGTYAHAMKLRQSPQ